MGQIIAMGDGGYTSPEDMKLNQYVVEQSTADRPRICLLAQAGGEHPEWTDRFHSAFSSLGCETSHLSLFFPHTSDIEDFLLSQEIIFVGGGNTKSMLALWREWGLDTILYKAWQQGTILAGMSAGAICWFEEGLTDSIPGKLTALPCLGFLKGSCAPHYNSEAERRPAFQRLIGNAEILAGYAIDDHAALHFVGEELHRVVSAVEGAGAYYVEPSEKVTVEVIQQIFSL